MAWQVRDAGFVAFIRNGIANAVTLEELEEYAHCGSLRCALSIWYKDSIGNNSSELKCSVQTTDELLQWITEAKGRVVNRAEREEIYYSMGFFTREPIRMPTRKTIAGPVVAKRGQSYVTNCAPGRLETHWLASRYTNFEVKYEGNAGLWMAVCDGLKVLCPETMAWLCNKDYSFNYRFDPLDSRWDLLAKNLPDIKYDKLFREQLEAEPNASAEWYRAMLSKYAGLTGRDYLAFFDEYRREYTRSFPILVRAGIIDLWDFFEKHRDDEATRSRYNSLEYVWSYASGVQNRKAFDFWKRFFENHTARDIPGLFPEKQFHDSFYERINNYWSSAKRLKYKRDFLSREENRLLYEWIEASAFVMAPDDFPNRAAEFLESSDTAELFEVDELRPIFEALIADNPQSSILCGLKRRFMSEEELEAEKKAQQEKQRQLELARADAERRQTVSKMDEKFDGTIRSIADFLDSVKWRRDERRYAAENAECLLVDALKDRTVLSREEYRLLLDILSDIVAYADGDDNLVRGVLKHMTMVKEERKAC